MVWVPPQDSQHRDISNSPDARLTATPKRKDLIDILHVDLRQPFPSGFFEVGKGYEMTACGAANFTPRHRFKRLQMRNYGADKLLRSHVRYGIRPRPVKALK